MLLIYSDPVKCGFSYIPSVLFERPTHTEKGYQEARLCRW